MFYGIRVSSIFKAEIGEITHRSRVDSNTVVLVIDLGPCDSYVVTASNVEGIGVVATLCISRFVINDRARDREARTPRYAIDLYWSVLNV